MMNTQEAPFAYALLQWIRAHRKDLAARSGIHPDAPRTSGLTESLTQRLFGFDRAFRGASDALRDPDLRTIASHELRHQPQKGRGMLTTDQMFLLRWMFADIALEMRDQSNAQSALGQQILDLPAPNQRLALDNERRFYGHNLSRMINQAEIHPKPKASLGHDGDDWRLHLETFIDTVPGGRGHCTTSFAKKSALIEAGPHPTLLTFGGWLDCTRGTWRRMQAQMEAWLKDQSLFAAPKDIEAEQIKSMASRLKRTFTAAELEFLSRHRGALLPACL